VAEQVVPATIEILERGGERHRSELRLPLHHPEAAELSDGVVDFEVDLLLAGLVEPRLDGGVEVGLGDPSRLGPFWNCLSDT
jgi:hypothetical protein